MPEPLPQGLRDTAREFLFQWTRKHDRGSVIQLGQLGLSIEDDERVRYAIENATQCLVEVGSVRARKAQVLKEIEMIDEATHQYKESSEKGVYFPPTERPSQHKKDAKAFEFQKLCREEQELEGKLIRYISKILAFSITTFSATKTFDEGMEGKFVIKEDEEHGRRNQ